MKIARYGFRNTEDMNEALVDLAELGGTDEEIDDRIMNFLAKVHEREPELAWPIFDKRTLH